jgi:hypothetical protein
MGSNLAECKAKTSIAKKRGEKDLLPAYQVRRAWEQFPQQCCPGTKEA